MAPHGAAGGSGKNWIFHRENGLGADVPAGTGIPTWSGHPGITSQPTLSSALLSSVHFHPRLCKLSLALAKLLLYSCSSKLQGSPCWWRARINSGFVWVILEQKPGSSVAPCAPHHLPAVSRALRPVCCSESPALPLPTSTIPAC